MISKKFILILILILTRVISTTTYAGTEGGNGGGVWVCQNKDNLRTIRKVELVDFYEAEKEFKYSIKTYPGLTQYEILDSYKKRILQIDKSLAIALEPYFLKLNEKLKPVDTDLRVIDDALYRVEPSQRWCENGVVSYQQLANYTDYGTILINEYIFNHAQVSQLAKAGLYLHEIIYEYFREKFQDRNSQFARRIVGIIASTLTLEEARLVLKQIRVVNNKYDMTFAKILKGTFVMGSPANEASHFSEEKQVLVNVSKDFLIMTTEITQLQWFKIMGKNPSDFKKEEDCPETFIIIKGQGLCPNNPVDSISYNDIQNFISKLNFDEGTGSYRLPTEAEWEYAARAGSKTAYSFGSDEIDHYAWHWDNSKNKTHEVATKLPNANGLYDMHGNVCELVQDKINRNDYLRNNFLPGGTDPVVLDGPNRVVRGGCYNSIDFQLRSADRGFMSEDHDNGNPVGFRLVKNL